MSLAVREPVMKIVTSFALLLSSCAHPVMVELAPRPVEMVAYDFNVSAHPFLDVLNSMTAEDVEKLKHIDWPPPHQ
jgi:hypothetical protein